MRATPDDILGMAFFAHVVEARSFSKAARMLGVSRSAVSARVARLEESLSVRLLHRTTRRLALTADGVRLYELCAKVVAGADEVTDLAAGATTVPRGTLRVQAPAGFAQHYLTGVIGELVRAHPALRLELRLGDHGPERIAEETDIALVIAGRLSDSGLTTRKLGRVRVVVCAAPSYLRTRGIPFRPQDLVHHDCLSHPLRQVPDELQTDEGTVSMTSLARVHADDARFLREAALAGLGIAMVPEPLVSGDLAEGRLREVLTGFQSIDLYVHAIHPHGRLPPASVRVFLDLLVERFREPPRKGRRTVDAPPRKTKGRVIAITEQDVRRLSDVADLYEELEPTRAAELRALVGRAKTLAASKMPRTTVTMSSRVQLRDEDGGEREVSLVYPWDTARERISVLSALGLELLGATVGTTIRDGTRSATIRAIPYQPEAAGDHHL